MIEQLTTEQISWIDKYLRNKVESGELTVESALTIEAYYHYNNNKLFRDNMVFESEMNLGLIEKPDDEVLEELKRTGHVDLTDRYIEESSRRITPPTEADIAEDRRKDAEKHREDDEASAKRRKSIAKGALIGAGVAAAGGLALAARARDKYYDKVSVFNNHLNKLADSADRSLDLAKKKYEKGEISKAKYDKVKEHYKKVVNSLTKNSNDAINYGTRVKDMNPLLNDLYRDTMSLRGMTKKESKPEQALHNVTYNVSKGATAVKKGAADKFKQSGDALLSARDYIKGQTSANNKKKKEKDFIKKDLFAKNKIRREKEFVH